MNERVNGVAVEVCRRESECEQMLNVDIDGRSDQFNLRIKRSVSLSSVISELSRPIRNDR